MLYAAIKYLPGFLVGLCVSVCVYVSAVGIFAVIGSIMLYNILIHKGTVFLGIR